MRVAPARDSFERAPATRKKALRSAHPDTATMEETSQPFSRGDGRLRVLLSD